MAVYYTFEADGPVLAAECPLCFRAESADAALDAMKDDCAAADTPLAGFVELVRPTTLATFAHSPTAEDLAEVARLTGIALDDLCVIAIAARYGGDCFAVTAGVPMYGPVWEESETPL